MCMCVYVGWGAVYKRGEWRVLTHRAHALQPLQQSLRGGTGLGAKRLLHHATEHVQGHVAGLDAPSSGGGLLHTVCVCWVDKYWRCIMSS